MILSIQRWSRGYFHKGTPVGALGGHSQGYSLHATVVQELAQFGDDINGYIRDLGKYVEPPTLIQYDHFGQRVDQLKTSEGWRQLKQAAAKEGMVSIAYDRATYGPLARVLMFIKTCLWTGDSHVVGCPMAMTDGAARVLELLGTLHMKERLLPRVKSRDPCLAYTAGQWMTERPGGSDISRTETTAHPVYPNHEKMKRLLTPVLKAFAADRAVGAMEECMAALGGLGYMEETGIGRLIRDSLVEKIWEGTINVLALDMLRAARGGAIKAFCEWSRDIIARHESDDKLVKALTLLESLNLVDSHARPALLLVAHIASASYLLEHAQWSRLELDSVIAQRWIEEGGLNEAVALVSTGPREEWDRIIVYAKL
ncbi:hypothetical protein RSAG8_11522, partial [Rhizoctonia solani AG-8 WAC10335]